MLSWWTERVVITLAWNTERESDFKLLPQSAVLRNKVGASFESLAFQNGRQFLFLHSFLYPVSSCTLLGKSRGYFETASGKL